MHQFSVDGFMQNPNQTIETGPTRNMKIIDRTCLDGSCSSFLVFFQDADDIVVSKIVVRNHCCLDIYFKRGNVLENFCWEHAASLSLPSFLATGKFVSAHWPVAWHQTENLVIVFTDRLFYVSKDDIYACIRGYADESMVQSAWIPVSVLSCVVVSCGLVLEANSLFWLSEPDSHLHLLDPNPETHLLCSSGSVVVTWCCGFASLFKFETESLFSQLPITFACRFDRMEIFSIKWNNSAECLVLVLADHVYTINLNDMIHIHMESCSIQTDSRFVQSSLGLGEYHVSMFPIEFPLVVSREKISVFGTNLCAPGIEEPLYGSQLHCRVFQDIIFLFADTSSSVEVIRFDPFGFQVHEQRISLGIRSIVDGKGFYDLMPISITFTSLIEAAGHNAARSLLYLAEEQMLGNECYDAFPLHMAAAVDKFEFLSLLSSSSVAPIDATLFPRTSSCFSLFSLLHNSHDSEKLVLVLARFLKTLQPRMDDVKCTDLLRACYSCVASERRVIFIPIFDLVIRLSKMVPGSLCKAVGCRQKHVQYVQNGCGLEEEFFGSGVEDVSFLKMLDDMPTERASEGKLRMPMLFLREDVLLAEQTRISELIGLQRMLRCHSFPFTHDFKMACEVKIKFSTHSSSPEWPAHGSWHLVRDFIRGMMEGLDSDGKDVEFWQWLGEKEFGSISTDSIGTKWTGWLWGVGLCAARSGSLNYRRMTPTALYELIMGGAAETQAVRQSAFLAFGMANLGSRSSLLVRSAFLFFPSIAFGQNLALCRKQRLDELSGAGAVRTHPAVDLPCHGVIVSAILGLALGFYSSRESNKISAMLAAELDLVHPEEMTDGQDDPFRHSGSRWFWKGGSREAFPFYAARIPGFSLEAHVLSCAVALGLVSSSQDHVLAKMRQNLLGHPAESLSAILMLTLTGMNDPKLIHANEISNIWIDLMACFADPGQLWSQRLDVLFYASAGATIVSRNSTSILPRAVVDMLTTIGITTPVSFDMDQSLEDDPMLMLGSSKILTFLSSQYFSRLKTMVYGTEGLRTTILLVSCMGVWAGYLYGIAVLASQENKRMQLNAYVAASTTACMLSLVLDMSEPLFSSLSVNIKMTCTSLVVILESLLVSASLCMRKTGHVPLLRQLRRMSRLGWSIPLSRPHVQDTIFTSALRSLMCCERSYACISRCVGMILGGREARGWKVLPLLFISTLPLGNELVEPLPMNGMDSTFNDRLPFQLRFLMLYESTKNNCDSIPISLFGRDDIGGCLFSDNIQLRIGSREVFRRAVEDTLDAGGRSHEIPLWLEMISLLAKGETSSQDKTEIPRVAWFLSAHMDRMDWTTRVPEKYILWAILKHLNR